MISLKSCELLPELVTEVLQILGVRLLPYNPQCSITEQEENQDSKYNCILEQLPEQEVHGLVRKKKNFLSAQPRWIRTQILLLWKCYMSAQDSLCTGGLKPRLHYVWD